MAIAEAPILLQGMSEEEEACTDSGEGSGKASDQERESGEEAV